MKAFKSLDFRVMISLMRGGYRREINLEIKKASIGENF